MNNKYGQKLIRVFFLFIILNNSCLHYAEGQNKIFKCDGIYQTVQQGWELRFRDTIQYFIDTIPVACIKEFKSVELVISPYNKKPILAFQLDSAGTKKFNSAAMQNIGKPLLIIFENEIIADPRTIAEIPDGKIWVEGMDNNLINRIVNKIKSSK